MLVKMIFLLFPLILCEDISLNQASKNPFMKNMHNVYNSIKNWSEDDRPREKLLQKGPMTLSNSELLAILINNGTKNKSAIDLSKEILKIGKDNLNELGKLTVSDFKKVKGIGVAKAVTIVAALELGRRRQGAEALEKPQMNNSNTVANFLKSILQDEQKEVFAVLFLNRANKVIGYHIVSIGGISGTIADPRIILKKSLEQNATGIILSHNHPSGNVNPSNSDIALTQKIKDAANLVDITVIDHIIIGNNDYYSFADNGIL